MTATAVLVCGLPGSGKTRYALDLVARGYTRLSIDEHVWRLLGRDPATLDRAEYASLQHRAEAAQWARLRGLLAQGVNLVVDNSFARRATRDRYRALIAAHDYTCELVYFAADLDTLRTRLAARNATDGPNSVTVTPELLAEYAAGFEVPRGEGERVVIVS